MSASEGPITHDQEPAGQDRWVSWAALLAGWVEFAKASTAFPRAGEGRRWRDSVAPAIGLQAVTFALGDLGRIAPDEAALALDRAEMLIDRHERELREAWRGEALNAELIALLSDSRTALEAARRMHTSTP